MRAITLSRQLDAADVNGIAESQTPLGAGNLVLDGVFVTAGVAILDQQRQILITPAGADAARTFTVTGTDDQDRTITEDVAGANNPATSVSVLNFKTVTQIAVDAATAGAIEVGTNGVGASQEIPLDQFISPFNVSLFIGIGAGAVDVTVQFTGDDVFASAGPFTWTAHPDLTNVVADGDGTFISPVTACRLLTNSGVDEAILRVLQAGLT